MSRYECKFFGKYFVLKKYISISRATSFLRDEFRYLQNKRYIIKDFNSINKRRDDKILSKFQRNRITLSQLRLSQECYLANHKNIEVYEVLGS